MYVIVEIRSYMDSGVVYVGTDTKVNKIRISGIQRVEEIPSWFTDEKLVLLFEKMNAAKEDWLSYCSAISFTDNENEVNVLGLSKEKDADNDENYPEDYVPSENYLFRLD